MAERLEIIRQQKENAYRQMAEFQKKIDHLECKEQHYMELLQTGAEDDCSPLGRKGKQSVVLNWITLKAQ